MNSPYEIISKKRDSTELTKQDIDFVIKGFISGDFTDYQMAALLMSIYLNGMTVQETAHLTQAMLESGEMIDFGTDISYVDKHSSGGVGDKTSFILAPIAAACGVRVPMMAGRGLGHTGGTIDKIESLPGFETTRSLETFKKDVIEYGFSLIGQSDLIAPADKLIYALRDVTATIESVPLITASIMSKKLAEGANGIVMDLKVGNGAFMKTLAQAQELSQSLLKTSQEHGRSMAVIISDMNWPLGETIGNAMELKECIEILKGSQNPLQSELIELSLELASHMIYLAGKAEDIKQAMLSARNALKSGKAFETFREMVIRQNGDAHLIDSPDQLTLAKETTPIKSPKDGYLNQVNCRELGLICVKIGGGRQKSGDQIDHSVGIKFHCERSSHVNKNDVIATIYHHEKQREIAQKMATEFSQKFIEIQETQKEPDLLIKDKLLSLSPYRKEASC